MGAGRLEEQGPTEECQEDPDWPYPLMVNLTTVSLEPAPLSSGWKSGSLPTGFTPTILTESPAGRPRRFRPQNLRRKPERGWREAAGGRGLGGNGDHDVSSRSSECRVTPGSRRAEGEETRTRSAARGARRAAPSSHRAGAEGASALAPWTSFPGLPVA